MAHLLVKEDGPQTYQSRDPVYLAKRWPAIQIVYDTKDDENFLYKTGIITKYMAYGTAWASMFDILLFPRPNPGLLNALSRIKFWAAPLVGGGIAYSSTVQLAANVRGKNDQWNHMYGGAAWGIVIGKCSRCFITGTLTAMLFGFTGFILKDCAMHGMFPDMPAIKRYGGAFSHKHDYTMLPDRAGYWVRTPAEVPKMTERGAI